MSLQPADRVSLNQLIPEACPFAGQQRLDGPMDDVCLACPMLVEVCRGCPALNAVWRMYAEALGEIADLHKVMLGRGGR